MGRRRQAREIALQALYVADTAKTPLDEAFKSVNRRAAGDAADDATLTFARELLDGARDRQSEIDRVIEETAANWTIARMAAVDRSMLRIAVFELLYHPRTPVGVIIDEAIEIVRKYSTEDSTRFINGILDKVKDRRSADGSKEGPR